MQQITGDGQDQNALIWIDLEMTGLNPEADRIIEPMLRDFRPPFALDSPRAVFAMVPVIWLEFVWFPSLFTALIFRRGLLMWLFNVVAVRRDGKPASGLRMFWRALTLAPIGLLLAFAALASNDPFGLGIRYGVYFAIGTTLGLMILSTAHPTRGISDRLAGTYLVPR